MKTNYFRHQLARIARVAAFTPVFMLPGVTPAEFAVAGNGLQLISRVDHFDTLAREPMVVRHQSGALFVAGYGSQLTGTDWTAPPLLWKSTDNGNSWERVDVGSSSAGAQGNSDVDLAEKFTPLNKSVTELRAAMDAGYISALELTRFYQHRITILNPDYHAVIAVNPAAESMAAGLDQERAEGKIRGPLHGIPVLLKDNINTRDALPTTAGSLALAENFAVQDAPLVAGLRAAGAVILGKTNLSEWANMRSSHSISGWSAVGGFTRNAFQPEMNPCGSSSGSAVAAALNLAPLTVGSETDGSIICPASMNGVVGIKPGAGLVSQEGIVPISQTQDTAGPIARSVGDAVLLLDAMLTPLARQRLGDLSRHLQAEDLNDLRIGVARAFNGHEAAVDAVFESALLVLKQAGAELLDVTDLQPDPALEELEMLILLTDMKADMAAYLKTAPDTVTVRSMDDLVAFNLAHAEQEMAHFKQEYFIETAAAKDLDDPQYRQALTRAHELAASKGIDGALKKYRLDLLIAPSYGVAGPLHDERKSITPEQPGSTQLSAVAAYPGITVPMGDVQGLPLGISFFAGKFSEPVLIRAAAVFEARRGALAAPEIDPVPAR